MKKSIFSYQKKLRLYISVDAGFYEAGGENFEWFISSQPGSKYEYRDDFRFSRNAIMMDAKFGLQFIINHFVLDFAFGLGAMFQNVEHTNREYPNDKMRTYGYPNISDMYLEEGRNVIPNFPLNFKVGYTF